MGLKKPLLFYEKLEVIGLYTILICDDDRDIVSALDIYLTSEGYRTLKAYDGLECLRLVERESVDLVLMDIMMPGLDGIRTTAKLRENRNIPIILLTAKSEDSDKVLGLNIGADDYVTKPFSLPVLYAKAMALTGRVQGINTFVELGGLKADIRSRSVQKGGEIIPLPPKEYEMLLFLMQNPGRVYSREQLLIRFWGYDFDGNERVVDNHIKKLRKAIGSCGCTIETVRKFGYRLSTENGNP